VRKVLPLRLKEVEGDVVEAASRGGVDVEDGAPEGGEVLDRAAGVGRHTWIVRLEYSRRAPAGGLLEEASRGPVQQREGIVAVGGDPLAQLCVVGAEDVLGSGAGGEAAADGVLEGVEERLADGEATSEQDAEERGGEVADRPEVGDDRLAGAGEQLRSSCAGSCAITSA
jgi:hypothetical protein